MCHIRDWQDGAACRAHSDCGIDGRSCRRRLCSDHGFCVTPEQVLHLATLVSSLTGQYVAYMRCELADLG